MVVDRHEWLFFCSDAAMCIFGFISNVSDGQAGAASCTPARGSPLDCDLGHIFTTQDDLFITISCNHRGHVETAFILTLCFYSLQIVINFIIYFYLAQAEPVLLFESIVTNTT